MIGRISLRAWGTGGVLSATLLVEVLGDVLGEGEALGFGDDVLPEVGDIAMP